MREEPTPIIFCDAVHSLGVHNGVARISLIRLGADGKPTPAVELMMPVAQLQTLIRTLQSVRA